MSWALVGANRAPASREAVMPPPAMPPTTVRRDAPVARSLATVSMVCVFIGFSGVPLGSGGDETA
jgi:hypothetical protein